MSSTVMSYMDELPGDSSVPLTFLRLGYSKLVAVLRGLRYLLLLVSHVVVHLSQVLTGVDLQPVSRVL